MNWKTRKQPEHISTQVWSQALPTLYPSSRSLTTGGPVYLHFGSQSRGASLFLPTKLCLFHFCQFHFAFCRRWIWLIFLSEGYMVACYRPQIQLSCECWIASCAHSITFNTQRFYETSNSQKQIDSRLQTFSNFPWQPPTPPRPSSQHLLLFSHLSVVSPLSPPLHFQSVQI